MILKKFDKTLKFLNKYTIIVLALYVIIVLLFYSPLFFSYFESDEWYHFTYYFPLTKDSSGLIKAFLSTLTNSNELSGGQHVIPISSTIFYINSYLFKLYYPPYALICLIIHAFNSFLIYLLLRFLLRTKNYKSRITYSLMAGIFFAFSPSPMHAVTGAAPFYGQNVLSVTFFLLCVIFYLKSFSERRKINIYYSAIFLICSLLTKETTAFLFILLPVITFLEKKIFDYKFLLKLYFCILVFYILVRFLVPLVSSGNIIEKITTTYIYHIPQSQSSDDINITSQDLSMQGNITQEIFFRSVTFPVKMVGGLFIPRKSIFEILQIITPVVYPLPGNFEELSRSQNRIFFRTGPGNDVLLYIFSLVIIGLIILILRDFRNKSERTKAKAVLLGFFIIILSSLPLVLIVLSFPRWGYDTYFDSRFYYNPNVGASIIFPFLVLYIAGIFSRFFKSKYILFFALLIFVIWLINTSYIFTLNIYNTVFNTGVPRREIISQFHKFLPSLKQSTVLFVETDGKGAYGSELPFQTNIPQAIILSYFPQNEIPSSIFTKDLLKTKKQGFVKTNNFSFGYFTDLKKISENLLNKKFSVSSVHAFYFNSKTNMLKDNTKKIRGELSRNLTKYSDKKNWSSYNFKNITFKYPHSLYLKKAIEKGREAVILKNDSLAVKIAVIEDQTFSLPNFKNILDNVFDVVKMKKVIYDTYHVNETLIVKNYDSYIYFLEIDDKVVIVNANCSCGLVESIIASINKDEK